MQSPLIAFTAILFLENQLILKSASEPVFQGDFEIGGRIGKGEPIADYNGHLYQHVKPYALKRINLEALTDEQAGVLEFINERKCTSSQSLVLHPHQHGFYIKTIQPHWVEGNRIDFSQFFSFDDIFPIEINVPDTIMSAWQGIESTWTAAADYFSMNEDESIPNAISFK